MGSSLSWFIDRFYIKKPRVRRFITWLLEGDSDKQVKLLGTSVTVNTIKEHGYLRASRFCHSSSLLQDEVAVLINLAFILDEQDTFLDIGANVGVYTHTISRFMHLCPELRIYSFEANPDTFSRLKASLSPEVHAEQIALSKETGSLDFVVGAVSHVFTTTSNASAYNLKNQAPTSVQARRLDECDILGNSLVIKIDVEGQELDVLEGATRLFEAGRIKAVYLDGYGNPKVEELLKSFGFHLFDGRTLKPTQGEIFSLLAIHPDKFPVMLGR